MAYFPRLRTGAVMQYPARRTQSYGTHVVRFLDGSEQRYRETGAAVRRWVIALEMLDEGEVAELEAFFQASQGTAGSFAFQDPWDGTEYPDCSLESDEFGVELRELGNCSASVVIRENRS